MYVKLIDTSLFFAAEENKLWLLPLEPSLVTSAWGRQQWNETWDFDAASGIFSCKDEGRG